MCIDTLLIITRLMSNYVLYPAFFGGTLEATFVSTVFGIVFRVVTCSTTDSFSFDENDKQRMIRSSDQKDLRKLPAMLRNKRWSVGRDTDVNVDIDKDVIQTQARGLEA